MPPSPPLPDLPSVPVARRLVLGLERGFARHWAGGDAFRTQWFNALSMSFPVGEQFFIDSVRAALPLVPPAGQAAWQARVRGFAAQEATHRHLHARVNAGLEAQGLVNHWQRWAARRIAWSRRLPALHHLAVTAAYEHYTAVLAHGLLSQPAWLHGADAAPALLWSWHAAEETEHRAVAFDLHRAAGGSRRARALWFLWVTLLFLAESSAQTLSNLWHDGTLLRASTWRGAARFVLGRHGLLRHAAGPALAYLRRDFHPARQPGAALAAAWLAAHADVARAIESAA